MVKLLGSLPESMKRGVASWAAKQRHLQRVWAWGSRARGELVARSTDLDLALEFIPNTNAKAELTVNRINWKRELSALTGVPVKDLELYPDPGSRADAAVREHGILLWERAGAKSVSREAPATERRAKEWIVTGRLPDEDWQRWKALHRALETAAPDDEATEKAHSPTYHLRLVHAVGEWFVRDWLTGAIANAADEVQITDGPSGGNPVFQLLVGDPKIVTLLCKRFPDWDFIDAPRQ